jgi:hypothetical protein
LFKKSRTIFEASCMLVLQPVTALTSLLDRAGVAVSQRGPSVTVAIQNNGIDNTALESWQSGGALAWRNRNRVSDGGVQ